IEKVEREQINPLQIQVDTLNKQEALAKQKPEGRARNNELRQVAGEIAKAESKLESARHEHYRLQVAKRYIDMLFPVGRLQTLAVVLGLVVLAVAIKGFFEFWQESL